MKGCAYCDNTKNYLKENNIEFKDKDVEKYEDDYELACSVTGMHLTPILLYGEDYLVPDRDFQEIEDLLETFKSFDNLTHLSYAKLAYEKIKTLEINIHNALETIYESVKPQENEHESTD